MLIHPFLMLPLLVVLLFAGLSTDISASHAAETKARPTGLTLPETLHEKADPIDNLITGAIQGSETGLPLPRFVSLRGKRTNMRIGPSLDHRVAWVYVKPGVPVEIIREFEVWRQIRDAEGQEGWVHKAMLSSRRMAIIAPWENNIFIELLKEPSDHAPAAAKLQAGVYSELEKCKENWCRIRGNQYSGWVKANQLWGVYEGETIE